ncbi:MAG: hypothetical protein KF729_12440 [Sandaracinaceae bacterium]|nr:hypothetical protein [Sandaracinaceae bacterium]
MDEPRRTERRRRALHAARAVTISLALGVGATGCSQSHGPRGDAGAGPSDGGAVTDASLLADAGHDAALADAGPIDCSGSNWWEHEECCDLNGGFWTGHGCAIPGPFVPPDLPA